MARSVRRERRELAGHLRDEGKTWPEIADALRERWSDLTALAAMRHAHGWTQAQALKRWQEIFDNRRRPEERELGRWEAWPGPGGVAPTWANLDRLAQLYECSAADLVTGVHDYRHLDDHRRSRVLAQVPHNDAQAGLHATEDRVPTPGYDEGDELRERLLNAAVVDDGAVALLGTQADHIREVDRMLGARAAEAQIQGHLAALDLLRTFAILPKQREPLAHLYSDAAALAGWQCLDLGLLNKSWKYYETAKNAAREEGTYAALAHALAEQAYVLAELGDLHNALQLVDYAHSVANTAAPPLLLSWLSAVQGEMYAAAGNDTDCRRAFETAERLLPADSRDPDFPYLVLDPVHLTRWRGNAFARLGDTAAIEDLRNALRDLDRTFTRARAGLHVDLAQALAASKQHAEARAELCQARTLATQVGSARQRRRIRRLESTYAA